MAPIENIYESLRANIRDGDVLLFSRKNTYLSALISRVQGNRHTHVALAKWDGDRLTTREFREFKGYDERYVSQLGDFDHVATHFVWTDEVEQFVNQARHQKYSYFKALIAVFPLPFWGRGYICSEFVAKALEGQLNLPANPTPGDLSLWFWENDFQITKVRRKGPKALSPIKTPNKLSQSDNLVPLFAQKTEGFMKFYKKYKRFQKPKRAVHTVFLHCSATDNPKCDSPQFIHRVHVGDNKWSDIGYHFYINKKGEIFHCRPLERTPAAQAPFNKGTIAICLGGLKKKKFTPSQFEALRWICEDIDAAYEGNIRFRGHCEVSAKSCPVFDYKAVLRLDQKGRMKIGVPTIEKLETSKSKHMKAAKRQEIDGDAAVAVGGGAVVTGTIEAAKEIAPLETLKEVSNKGLEYKALGTKLHELLVWFASLEGMMTASGVVLILWGWRKWRTAKALKQARLKEEPKLKRLEREALEAYT